MSDSASEKRILFAEDNKTLRYLVKRQLNKLGYVCDIACNGAEAADLAQKNHYDLILMDIQMPVMSGLEATAMIRAIVDCVGDNSDIPIVAMTANPDKQQCFDAGCSDYLFKPVSLNQLETAMKRWLAA